MEEEKLTGKLKHLANQWRERLADPAMKKLVKSGRASINPLVKELIGLFPESKDDDK